MVACVIGAFIAWTLGVGVGGLGSHRVCWLLLAMQAVLDNDAADPLLLPEEGSDDDPDFSNDMDLDIALFDGDDLDSLLASPSRRTRTRLRHQEGVQRASSQSAAHPTLIPS